MKTCGKPFQQYGKAATSLINSWPLFLTPFTLFNVKP